MSRRSARYTAFWQVWQCACGIEGGVHAAFFCADFGEAAIFCGGLAPKSSEGAEASAAESFALFSAVAGTASLSSSTTATLLLFIMAASAAAGLVAEMAADRAGLGDKGGPAFLRIGGGEEGTTTFEADGAAGGASA